MDWRRRARTFEGHHIYDPLDPAGRIAAEPVSLTVIAADVLDADRFATAAFAMGQAGIAFIEGLDGCEGYLVDGRGTATYTSGFASYVAAGEPMNSLLRLIDGLSTPSPCTG